MVLFLFCKRVVLPVLKSVSKGKRGTSISILVQVSESLREAQNWFKTKFGNLQAELARSR